MVDALGGVTVNNIAAGRRDRPPRARGQPAGVRDPAGAQAPQRIHRPRSPRSRETTSDYDRMQRQRCVIGSLARQTQPAEVLAAFPKLVKVLKRSVATDIPASRLPALIEAAGDQPVKVATVGFTPLTSNSGWSSGYPIPDVPKVQRTVRRMTSQAVVTTTTRPTPTGSARPRPPGPGQPQPLAAQAGLHLHSADPAGRLQAWTATAGRSRAARARARDRREQVLAPARQVVRRLVVQMVGSRHSSLSPPPPPSRPRRPGRARALPDQPRGQPSSHAFDLRRHQQRHRPGSIDRGVPVRMPRWVPACAAGRSRTGGSARPGRRPARRCGGPGPARSMARVPVGSAGRMRASFADAGPGARWRAATD